MKYRTKVRELEAIRFDGTNVEAINALTGLKGSKLEIANAIECGLDVVFNISDVQ